MALIPIIQLASDAMTCGGCVACCKALGVPSIEKEPGVWCPHCVKKGPGQGCAVYETRPVECAGYMCVWRSGVLGSRVDWRPDKLRVLFDVDEKAVFLNPGEQLIVAKELIGGAILQPIVKAIISRFIEAGLMVWVREFSGGRVLMGNEKRVREADAAIREFQKKGFSFEN